MLSEKNPYFGKHLFGKQELIARARLCGQDFATSKNFSFNLCHTKSFAFFSQEGKLFYKSNRQLFSCVCIAWYKHSRHWENSRQLCKPSTSSRVCTTVSNSPNPSRVYIRLCKHGKRFLLLKKLRTSLNACLIRAEIKLLIKRPWIFCSILGAKFTVLFFSKLSFEKYLVMH